MEISEFIRLEKKDHCKTGVAIIARSCFGLFMLKSSFDISTGRYKGNYVQNVLAKLFMW